jgi:period circadian protein 2
MEGGGAASTHNTKISDSAYSNSCSNSQSQRSGSSSKSRESNCSGSSSGYGGKEVSGNVIPQPLSKRSKDRKKKKLKGTIQTGTIADDTQKPDITEIVCDEISEKTTGMMRRR